MKIYELSLSLCDLEITKSIAKIAIDYGMKQNEHNNILSRDFSKFNNQQFSIIPTLNVNEIKIGSLALQ